MDGAQHAASVISRMERHLAKARGRIGEDALLDCDEAAAILCAILQRKGIDHIDALGKSDEGSSHAWVIVNGINYDPTEQGYGNGNYESGAWHWSVKNP